MGRQPRDERRRDVRVVLSERDRALLLALGRFRVATTFDLIRYGFSGTRPDTAARRLRRLFDAKYFEVHSPNRARKSLYSLGRRGRDWMADVGRPPGRIPKAGLAHHLAIVRAWIDLALAAAVAGVSVVRFVPEWEIREAAGAVGGGVVPDALFQLQGSGSDHIVWTLRAALEVDLGNERPQVLARKLRAYEQLQLSPSGLFGWQSFCLAMALPEATEQRKKMLGDLLTGSTLQWWTWRTEGELADLLRHLAASTSSPYDLPLRQGEVLAANRRQL